VRSNAYVKAPAPTLARLAAPEVGGALGALDAAAVLRYARGLRHKRWDDVRATVPLSTRISPTLGARYQAWLAAHPPAAQDTVLPPGAAEALRALPALTHDLADDPGEASWAADLLAFETLRACARADGQPRTLHTQVAVHQLVDELHAGLLPVDPPRDPHRYAFEGASVRVSRRT